MEQDVLPSTKKFVDFSLNFSLHLGGPGLQFLCHLEPCLDPCLELCLELSLLALKCLALESSRWICLARCSCGLQGLVTQAWSLN